MVSLLWLFAIPLLGAIALLFLKNVPMVARRFAMVWSLLPFFMLIAGDSLFVSKEVIFAWFTPLGIDFHARIDGLSQVFLYLTAIVVPISCYVVPKKHNAYLFLSLILALQSFLMVFFTARDLAVFVVFWEAILLPVYFMLLFWGGPERQKAAIKFFIYMVAGSTLMVAAVLALYMLSSAQGNPTFNMDVLAPIANSLSGKQWIFWVMLLAFVVKTPLFPFHGWLPDAYCQAPAAGSILLSSLLSKAGIYGVLRIGIEFFPSLLERYSPWFVGFAVVGVLYGAFAASMQKDFKRLIAYSSLSHVNFILIGAFLTNSVAHSASALQAFNHGITITALFLVAYWLEIRLKSTSMAEASGLAKYVPKLCWVTFIFVLASIALPSTSNFIGEILILFSLFTKNFYLAAILAVSVILSAVYMLRFMQKIYFEKPSPFESSWVDIGNKEIAIAAPLVLLIFLLGINPSIVLDELKPMGKDFSTSAISKDIP